MPANGQEPSPQLPQTKRIQSHLIQIQTDTSEIIVSVHSKCLDVLMEDKDDAKCKQACNSIWCLAPHTIGQRRHSPQRMFLVPVTREHDLYHELINMESPNKPHEYVPQHQHNKAFFYTWRCHAFFLIISAIGGWVFFYN